MIRVVLDTNVLVSAVLGKALAPILNYWRNDRFILVVSSDIVAEYIAVLRRPKFGLPPEVVSDISAYLIRQAEFVTPYERLRVVAEDPADNRFLEAAVTAEADYVVSGDKHLLQIGEFLGIPIVDARTFLEQLELET